MAIQFLGTKPPPRVSPAAQAIERTFAGFRRGRERGREAAESGRRFDIEEAGRAATREQRATQVQNTLITNLLNVGYREEHPGAEAGLADIKDDIGARVQLFQQGQISQQDLSKDITGFQKKIVAQEPVTLFGRSFRRIPEAVEPEKPLVGKDKAFKELLDQARTPEERTAILRAQAGIKEAKELTPTQRLAEAKALLGLQVLQQAGGEELGQLGRAGAGFPEPPAPRVPPLITEQQEEEELRARGLEEATFFQRLIPGGVEALTEIQQKERADLIKEIEEQRVARRRGVPFVPSTITAEMEEMLKLAKIIEKQMGLPEGTARVEQDAQGNLKVITEGGSMTAAAVVGVPGVEETEPVPRRRARTRTPAQTSPTPFTLSPVLQAISTFGK